MVTAPPPPPDARRVRPSPLLVRAMAIVVAVVAIELASGTGLFLLGRFRDIRYRPTQIDSLDTRHRDILERIIGDSTRYTTFSPSLGWTIKPYGEEPPRYRANRDGLRGRRDYDRVPPAGVVRLAAFGDSFTHGDGVTDEETWESVLERSTDGVEVLNFGVGGYGLDQALLRWRAEGVPFRPDVVLIGLMSENLLRHVNVYRPFYTPNTGVPLAKPRFVLSADSLVLIPNPARSIDDYRMLLSDTTTTLERFGRRDSHVHWYDRGSPLDWSPTVRLLKAGLKSVLSPSRRVTLDRAYRPNSEPFRLTLALIDRFAREVRTAGANPVVLLFPSRDDLAGLATGRLVYRDFADSLRAHNLAVIDLADGFDPCRRGCDLDRLAPGHYSAEGNQLVATVIGRRLRELNLLGHPRTDSVAASQR